jgi:predicted HAD superfamily Cof-like phosphohydrolase
MTDKFYNGRKEQLSNFEYVGVFMHTFGQEVKYQAEFPSKDICKLRVELIAEELGELKEAIRDKDIVEVADALTDLLYVVYGAGHAFGIDLDKCFNEVHRSNMSKLGLDGKPIYREDGKILKGQNYFDPDLITIVQGDDNGKETNE